MKPELLAQAITQIETYKSNEASSGFIPTYANGASDFVDRCIVQRQSPLLNNAMDFLRLVKTDIGSYEFLMAQDWLCEVWDLIILESEL